MDLKCNYFIIPSQAVPANDADDCEITEQQLAAGTLYLQRCNLPVRWGDLVRFECMEDYRNCGVTIFDGTKLIDLIYEPDEYGNLPQQFRVLERMPGSARIIPIRYWDKIRHNNYVWFDHRPYASELLNSLHWENKFLPSPDYPDHPIPALVASCTIANKKYHVVPFSDSDLLGSYEPEEWNDQDRCMLKASAVKALCSPNLIPFEYACDYYLLPKDNTNVMFLNVNEEWSLK